MGPLWPIRDLHWEYECIILTLCTLYWSLLWPSMTLGWECEVSTINKSLITFWEQWIQWYVMVVMWCVSGVQVDLTEPILSRFDILCVVRDVVDPVEVRPTPCHFHSVCFHFLPNAPSLSPSLNSQVHVYFHNPLLFPKPLSCVSPMGCDPIGNLWEWKVISL